MTKRSAGVPPASSSTVPVLDCEQTASSVERSGDGTPALRWPGPWRLLTSGGASPNLPRMNVIRHSDPDFARRLSQVTAPSSLFDPVIEQRARAILEDVQRISPQSGIPVSVFGQTN